MEAKLLEINRKGRTNEYVFEFIDKRGMSQKITFDYHPNSSNRFFKGYHNLQFKGASYTTKS